MKSKYATVVLTHNVNAETWGSNHPSKPRRQVLRKRFYETTPTNVETPCPTIVTFNNDHLEGDLVSKKIKPRGEDSDPGIQGINSRDDVDCDRSYAARFDDENADVGLLGCSGSQFCAESSESYLGGKCVDREFSHTWSIEILEGEKMRNLQDDYGEGSLNFDYCNSLSPAFGTYECDCTEFDLETETGSFACTMYEFYCFFDGICGSQKIANTITLENPLKVDYCFGFQEPFPAELCYSVTTDNKCSIVVNGVYCNDCEIVDMNEDELGMTSSYYCYKFDCSNTMAQVAGNDCMGVFIVDSIFPDGANSTSTPTHDSTVPPTDMPINSIAAIVITQKPTTSAPSYGPSQYPTADTKEPSEAPTPIPSAVPTSKSSVFPSDPPSTMPSQGPSKGAIHSEMPSAMPSHEPATPQTPRPSLTFASTRTSMEPSTILTLEPTRMQLEGQSSEAASSAPSIGASGSPTKTPWERPSSSTLQPTGMTTESSSSGSSSSSVSSKEGYWMTLGLAALAGILLLQYS